MTQGKALIQARNILGDTAHVRYDPSLPYPCKVGYYDEDGWCGLAVGRTWEEALEDTRRVAGR